ncbi:GAD domain-containing protein, partial [Clostridium perfringens]|uniref:GAD domain-containing protein n=1 Tax=Clostridium perfringens TaxID=1502 RepID=UPI0037544422
TDKHCESIEIETGNKVYWFKVDENGEFVGGISKFLKDKQEEIIKALSLKKGDFIGLCAGTKRAAQKTSGVLRRVLGVNSEGHFDKDNYNFCW